MSVPIIVIICYMVGEVYKVIFRKREEAYRLIPIVMGIVGGIVGMIMYLTNKEMIFNARNIWEGVEIGIVSGISSTGTNQIIKQMIKK